MCAVYKTTESEMAPFKFESDGSVLLVSLFSSSYLIQTFSKVRECQLKTKNQGSGDVLVAQKVLNFMSLAGCQQCLFCVLLLPI